MTITDTAIVLAREPWRESDKRVVFLTEHHGKISAIAVGAHKIMSKLAGHIEPFREVMIMYADGKRSYKLAQAVTIQSFLDRPVRVYVARALGELIRLVDRVTIEGVSDGELYHLVRAGLISINESIDESDCDVRSGVALIVVATHAGYAPQFLQCVVCGSSDNLISFGVQMGGVVCSTCRTEGVVLPYQHDAGLRKTYVTAFLKWRQLL